MQSCRVHVRGAVTSEIERVSRTHPATPACGGSGLTITPPPLSFLTMPPPLSFETRSLEGDLELLPWTLWLGVDCGDIAIWILRSARVEHRCQVHTGPHG